MRVRLSDGDVGAGGRVVEVKEGAVGVTIRIFSFSWLSDWLVRSLLAAWAMLVRFAVLVEAIDCSNVDEVVGSLKARAGAIVDRDVFASCTSAKVDDDVNVS